jgi:hypothetical protein
MQTIIRDTVTGRFASFETFNRSHAQGGTRYETQLIGPPPDVDEEPIEDDFEPYDIEFGVDYGEDF